MSAKDNINVDTLFNSLTEKVIEFTDSKIQETVMGNVLEDLEVKRKSQEGKNKCCTS